MHFRWPVALSKVTFWRVLKSMQKKKKSMKSACIRTYGKYFLQYLNFEVSHNSSIWFSVSLNYMPRLHRSEWKLVAALNVKGKKWKSFKYRQGGCNPTLDLNPALNIRTIKLTLETFMKGAWDKQERSWLAGLKEIL